MRPFAANCLRSVDLDDVFLPARAEVGLEAFAAPPLVAVLVAVERFQRERLLASFATPLGSVQDERMFASEADGKAVSSVAEVAPAREDHCHSCCVAGVDCGLVVLRPSWLDH